MESLQFSIYAGDNFSFHWWDNFCYYQVCLKVSNEIIILNILHLQVKYIQILCLTAEFVTTFTYEGKILHAVLLFSVFKTDMLCTKIQQFFFF